jgi:hypothetical protein
VGNNPDPLAEVRSPETTGAKYSPSRIEPHRGQVSENSSEPERSEIWRILHEDEAWSYFANDPGHLQPDSAFFSVDALASSCRADVLTRESAGDDID